MARSSEKATGDASDGQQDDRVVRIRDAIPVAHTYISLPGPLEIALGMLDAQCKLGGGDEIVGYYQCNESKSNAELGAIGKKVADTVDGVAGKGSAVLVLDAEKLKSIVASKAKDKDVPLVLYTKVSNKGWSRKLGLNCPTEGMAERLEEYVREGRHTRIVDFEDHVDDISKNWLNSDII
eukprot:jgi/Picsp_1/2615/NSC_00845-R1_protein